MSPNVVVVEDTLKDSRFKDHSFVVGEPKLRFYAGAPITFPGDLRLGTVCLADIRPRLFSKADMMVLEHLAMQVVQKLASIPEGVRQAGEPELGPIEGVADIPESGGVRAWKQKTA